MTNALHISLGHNSSAILVRDNSVLCGYEQERIDRKKSSGVYPRGAIDLCLAQAETDRVDTAYVSHWFDDLTLRDNKYLDLLHLRSIAGTIIPLTEGFSHHDAHASSAASFFRSNGGMADEIDILVLDGFGTSQECFSMYQSHHPLTQFPRLVHRTYGYQNSLGLMYQYITEYLGMKPNRDEYKLLGYESHIATVATSTEIKRAIDIITMQAHRHAQRMLEQSDRPERSPDLIAYDELAVAKAAWFRQAEAWARMFGCYSPKATRICVAFCAQLFLEETMVRLLEMMPRRYGSQPHLLLAGGCFYNVKLNRRLQVATGRRVFSHPLAGDQGASLGFTPGVEAKGLTWGVRTIGERTQLPPGVITASQTSWVEIALMHLRNNAIVNVVRGGMEYGPRALCHTTTLASPTRDNVARINAINERDEAMPMAPVITRKAAMSLFRHADLLQVPISDRFMITTVAFNGRPSPGLMGVAHKDPLEDRWTARPQIVDEGDPMHDLLTEWGGNQCLINTSFNYHGEPIVFTEDDACVTHSAQSFRAQVIGAPQPITILVQS